MNMVGVIKNGKEISEKNESKRENINSSIVNKNHTSALPKFAERKM
jgi:hypothetical protein